MRKGEGRVEGKRREIRAVASNGKLSCIFADEGHLMNQLLMTQHHNIVKLKYHLISSVCAQKGLSDDYIAKSLMISTTGQQS